MKKRRQTALDFEIDILTNSIQNTISGDIFQTEVSRLTKVELKQVTKKMVGHLTGKLNLIIMQRKFTN